MRQFIFNAVSISLKSRLDNVRSMAFFQQRNFYFKLIFNCVVRCLCLHLLRFTFLLEILQRRVFSQSQNALGSVVAKKYIFAKRFQGIIGIYIMSV